MEAMLMLGPYKFGLDTAAFNELNRNTEWRWPSQDVFDSRPVLQFTGWGDDSITLPGVIFPEYWGGTTQLDELRALGDTGKPQTLIDGRGNVMGQWVISGVSERGSVFAQRGVARRQEFTVNLKRYQDNGAAALPAAASSIVKTDSITGQAGSIVAGASSMASKYATSLAGAAANVKALVGSVVTPVQGALNAIGQATSMVSQISRVASDAQGVIKSIGSISNLSQAQSALGGIMRTASEASNVAARASKTVSGTVSSMQTAGESAGAIATVKSAMLDLNRAASAAAGIRAQAENIVRTFS